MTFVRDVYPMTIEDFLAFTETRPDGEFWELIDGEPVMNPSPSYGHQRIARNLIAVLANAEDRGAEWQVLPGLGAKLSDTSAPVPDVLVRPATIIDGSYCDDMIAAFEVISPSSVKRDLHWKRQAYATLPSLHHYVVLSQTRIDVRCFDRASGWVERRLTAASDVVRLDQLGVEMEIAQLYRGTGL